MPLSAGTRLGSYEILSALGAGGMGEVYRARDTRLDRDVAVKIIPADRADSGMIRRFQDEALSASRLNHPNILTVHEYGAQAGIHFLVTELVEGESLRQALANGALPLKRALNIAIEVASALDAAHAAGIVHRDIKPENIMLRPDGYVKVLDFGLAKMTPSAADAMERATISLRTVPGVILGTMGYMPPEQVRGTPVDVRADIWSAGVVLHEMVSGRSPFAGPTTSDVIAAVLEREPPSLASSGVEAPPELERIIAKALAKDRDERYQIVRELLVDLKRLRQQLDTVVVSREMSAGTQPQVLRLPSRRRAGVVLSALMTAAIVLAGSLVAWSAWQRTRDAAHRGTDAAATNSANALPLRRMTYWLTVQRMREGRPFQEPFQSTGAEIFDSGDKFSLNVQSPDTGYLYLLNKGSGSKGRPTLNILFPPREAQVIQPNQPVKTSPYGFDPNPGIEQFWLVWSATHIEELDKAVGRWLNPTYKGDVHDPVQAAAIEQFLRSHLSSETIVDKNRQTRRTVVEGHGDVVVQLVEIEHR